MPKITAYRVGNPKALTLEPSPVKREWIDRLPQQFAKRCLPILMANQSGWIGRIQEGFTAFWGGDDCACNISIVSDGDGSGHSAASHFGHGVLTFTMPFLFRTDPGVNLLVRGPANDPKDGIAPLEGLVETDWTDTTFTMNWKFTRPGAVRFEAGEAIVMIVPQARGDLEGFSCAISELAEDPKLQSGYQSWARSRSDFNRRLTEKEVEAVKQGWQRDYFQGKNQGGERTQSHQTNRKLGSF